MKTEGSSYLSFISGTREDFILKFELFEEFLIAKLYTFFAETNHNKLLCYWLDITILGYLETFIGGPFR